MNDLKWLKGLFSVLQRYEKNFLSRWF